MLAFTRFGEGQASMAPFMAAVTIFNDYFSAHCQFSDVSHVFIGSSRIFFFPIGVIAIGACQIRKVVDKIANVDIFIAFGTVYGHLLASAQTFHEDFQIVGFAIFGGLGFACCAVAGDQVVGIGYSVFEVRVKNSDNQKGTSGGYRLMYYLKTSFNVLLLAIYSKSGQDDVAAEDLRMIIEEYDRSNSHKATDRPPIQNHKSKIAPLSNQLVILCMSPNPKPRDAISNLNAQRTMIQPSSDGPILFTNFLEVQGRMSRMSF